MRLQLPHWPAGLRPGRADAAIRRKEDARKAYASPELQPGETCHVEIAHGFGGVVGACARSRLPQWRGRAARAARRRRPRCGRGLLHGVPPDQHDHLELRLYARGLEGTDRHDDRPVGRRGSRADHDVPRRAFSRQTPSGAPKLVPGPVQISFKEWVTPTLGQRSRDPVQAADGSIWWAGQFGNLIGELDPATGEMKEYHAAGQRHAAHGDPRCQGQHLVHRQQERHGRLSRSQDRQDHRLQDAGPGGEGSAHPDIRHATGSRWFTLQNSNMVGRLDPATGNIKLVTMKTPNSKPYGIKIDAEGNPWFSCNGRHCLYKIDPATMALTEVKLPLARHHGAPARHRRRRHDLVRQFRRGAGSAATIRRPARSRNGRRRAVRSRIPMPSSSWTASSGTTNPACGRTRWCASIPRPRRSRAGRFPRAASMPASSATCGRRTDGNLLIHQSSTNRIIQVTVQRRAASR